MCAEHDELTNYIQYVKKRKSYTHTCNCMWSLIAIVLQNLQHAPSYWIVLYAFYSHSVYVCVCWQRVKSEGKKPHQQYYTLFKSNTMHNSCTPTTYCKRWIQYNICWTKCELSINEKNPKDVVKLKLCKLYKS